MNCPKCGQDGVPDGAHFCSECGAAILTAPKPAAQIEVTQEVGTVEGGQVVGVDIGQVLGDVNIGNYTLRIGSVHGGVVNIAPPQQQRLPQPRPLPVFLLPRRSPGLLDRKAEVATATTTLQSASPVEFHGPAGVGKTKLLHHLAHDKLTSAFSDGVVYFSALRHKPVEDLLLDLFDAFYEREATYKPTPVQVRRYLQDERALIGLDDVDLERDDVAAIMDAAPNCTFLLASMERCLWGEGRAIALRGLPPDDALALVERELGRLLTAEERPAAEALCAALESHPLRLLQLVALVREDGRELTDLAARLRIGSPAESLREQALGACSEQEQQILAALAVSRGASLGEQHVSVLAGIADVAPVLGSLQRRKLVQSYSPRYSLAGSLDEALREEWDLSPWNEQALEHFANWAEQQRQAPERVTEEAGAILGILQWARQEGRWEEALRLGRAVEGILAVGGQWGAWAQVLGWGLQAARALGDRTAEAWSLHQSGTRALCLEETSAARADLTQALQLRESLGDWEGAAVTRHNLDLLGGLGGDHGPEGNGAGGGSRWWRPWLWPGVIALVAALVLFGLTASWIFGAPLSLKGSSPPSAATPSSSPDPGSGTGAKGSGPKKGSEPGTTGGAGSGAKGPGSGTTGGPGSKKIAVPDLKGKTPDQASTNLKDVGLKLGDVTYKNDAAPKGTIVEQDPAARGQVTQGTSVKVTVSSGPQKIAVPNLSGKTPDEASTILKAASLTLGSQSSEPSDTASKGKIIKQDPSARSQVDPGGAVNITIGSGPTTEPTTDPIF